jgi:hypothetical protein
MAVMRVDWAVIRASASATGGLPLFAAERFAEAAAGSVGVEGQVGGVNREGRVGIDSPAPSLENPAHGARALPARLGLSTL